MYLFSAIKDAIFSGRRSSVSGERPRLSESGGLRRSASEAYLLPQSSPSGSDRDGPIGSKSKRLEPERAESLDHEPPKRRRTTIGGDRERISSRLSIDRADAPSLTSRARLPSPLPRQSMPGLIGGRRSSVVGSPLPAAQLGRASPRPQTPTHPKFVDLLRRDPSQQRALESARSILDTLDRVTQGGGVVGGSARKYRPPQPLRPMRFKSLSSTRPVSLHDMLTGAVSSAPPTPAAPAVNKVSPLMQPLVLPGVASKGGDSPRPGSILGAKEHAIPSIFGKVTESPKHAPIPSIFGGKVAESPKHASSIFGKGADSPKRSFSEVQSIGNKGSDSPKRVLLAPPESPKRTLAEPARQPSPMKKLAVAASPLKKPAVAPLQPAAGGFVFGDPSKVTDADFFDDDCFAPGADDSSGSDSDGSPASKSGDVSAILSGGKSIFGQTTPTGSLPSLFSSNAPVGEIKSIFGAPSGQSSIFGSTAANPEKKAEPASIFGSSGTATGKQAETASIFGASKPAEPVSIFGAAAASTGKSEPSSLFGATSGEKKPEQSIFGSTSGDKKPEQSIFGAAPAATQPVSIFGSAPAPEKQAEPASIFGSALATEKKTEPASIFGSTTSSEKKTEPASIFGQTTSTEKKPESLFGSNANNDTVTFGGLSGPTKTDLPSSFPVPTGGSMFGSEPKPATSGSLFGAAPSSSGSIFGATDPRPAAEPAKKPETPSATSGMFVFGATPPASPHPNTQTSLFGSAPANPSQPSNVFGASAASGSIFGAPAAPAQTNNMFGSSAAPAGGIFGSSNPQPSNVFGGAATANPFGSAAPANPFGGPTSQPSTPSNLFGAGSAPTPSGSSIFGNGGASSGSIFGSGGDQSSSAFSFGAAAAGTPTSDNPFAASGDDFGKGAPKRKILKAARRT